ncbi:hypothetical protein HKX48_000306, partial [Thoreauomyces humboldtii]
MSYNSTLADVVASLQDQCNDNVTAAVADALANQAGIVSDSLSSVGPLGTLTIHFFIFALLGDRLMDLRHKPTICFFIASVTFNIMVDLWGIVANSPIDYFWTDAGTVCYYWVNGILNSLGEFTVSCLTYLRISSSIRVRYGRNCDLVGKCLMVGVFLFEISKFAKYDIETGVYEGQLLYLSLCIDVVWAVTTLRLAHTDDITYGALGLWFVDHVALPWKPYLV